MQAETDGHVTMSAWDEGRGWKLGGQSGPVSAADAQMTASMARSTARALAGSQDRFVKVEVVAVRRASRLISCRY
jgi:hypothetical protein